MSEKPYYGPVEDKATIDLERFFLAGDFIAGVGYGMQLLFWTICARYLWKQRQRGKQTTFLLGYITLLLVIETIFAIVQTRTVQDIYIENRNYPGGPWQYFLDTQSLAVNVMYYATLFLMTFLCDLLVLWRCWIIWTASGRHVAYMVNVLPVILLVASFVMGTLWTLESSHPGLSMYSAQPLAYGTAYYALSLGVNIILTVLIVARLLMYRRTHMAHLPPEHAQQYLSLATLIIESAALYSAFAIASLVSYAIDNPISQIWLGSAQAAQQVSTYLIIYRVADGKAWTKKTMASETLTTMNFDARGGAQVAQRRGGQVTSVQFSTDLSMTGIHQSSDIDVESMKVQDDLNKSKEA